MTAAIMQQHINENNQINVCINCSTRSSSISESRSVIWELEVESMTENKKV